jgi:MerR family transcriptional regulator, copper efflux regulator
MNISKAATLSGLPDKTLRYYEDIGLINPQRGDNGYREYSPEQVKDLVFLRRTRQFGFTLRDCAQLLQLFRNPSRECREVYDLAAQKLAEMDNHINELLAMRDELRTLVEACPNDQGPNCTIINSFAEAVSP